MDFHESIFFVFSSAFIKALCYFLFLNLELSWVSVLVHSYLTLWVSLYTDLLAQTHANIC